MHASDKEEQPGPGADGLRPVRRDRRPGQAAGAAGLLPAGPARACCPGSGCWSATAAATSRTRTSASTCTTRSPSSARSPASKEWKAFARAGVLRRRRLQPATAPAACWTYLAKAREALGGDPQLVHYLAVPPVAFDGADQGARPARAGHGRPGGVREAVRHLTGSRSASWTGSSTRSWTSSRCTGSTISWARRPPRTCTCCASPTACSPRCGTASTSSRCRSTCRRSSASPTGPVFYDATGAVLDMLVTHLFQVAAEVAMEPPASLGALDLQAAREKVIRSFRPLDPAEVVLGQFDRLPQGARGGGQVRPGHVRGGPAVDRQPALARRAVLPAHRQAAGGNQAAGQPDPARAARAAGRAAARRGQRAVVLAGRRRRDRPVPGGQEARARLWTWTMARRRSRCPACAAPTRCRRTSG